MHVVTRARRCSGGNGQRGQGLVEFSLVLPIFLVVFMGTIEFALAFNAVLGVNYATRNAALLAAEAGSSAGSDCVILKSVEIDIESPADRAAIQTVEIYWADGDGDLQPGEVNVYTRGGSMTCTYPDDSTITVPYTATSLGYPETERCNVIKGCSVAHPGLDNVGVRITYRHDWRTPLAALLGSGGAASFSFGRSNAMRMEPVL